MNNRDVTSWYLRFCIGSFIGEIRHHLPKEDVKQAEIQPE
jgi:hypothetical protein